MLQTIREGCFETNSSSMHSILITKNDVHVKPEEFNYRQGDYNDEILWLFKGRLSLRDVTDGFGRYPFRLLTTFREKLEYALCSFLGYYYMDEPEAEEKYNEILEVAKEICPDIEKFDIYTKEQDIYLDEDNKPILHRDVIVNYEEKNPRYFYTKDGELKQATLDQDDVYELPNIGCVDHQSSDLLERFLEEKDITLKEFLSNKKYVVVIDGDEYYEFDKYMNAGFIDKNFIKERFK